MARNVAELRDKLIAMLDELKAQGLKIAGYGAPAKGNTLLNFFDIGQERRLDVAPVEGLVSLRRALFSGRLVR